MHPDDEFHPPTSDDPEWTETCWFTFAVPERNLSGQLYPYFKTNQGVAAGGAFFWDGRNERPETCVYAKQFWHLPLIDQKLTDLTLANGIRYELQLMTTAFVIVRGALVRSLGKVSMVDR